MKPINEWIIVEQIKEELTTASGIILPGKEKKLLIQKSKVIAISDDIAPELRKEEKELRFAIGDVVFHHREIGINVDPHDKDNKLMFMKHNGVMGVE